MLRILCVLSVLATVAVASLTASRPAEAGFYCYSAANYYTSVNTDSCATPSFNATDFGWISTAGEPDYAAWVISSSSTSNINVNGITYTPSTVWVSYTEDNEQYWSGSGAFVQLKMTGQLNIDDADGWVDARATYSAPNPDWVHNFSRITIEEQCP